MDYVAAANALQGMRMTARAIAFGVNETLLDLRVFEELPGDASLRAQWFAQMLQVVFVGAITDRYVEFTRATPEPRGPAPAGSSLRTPRASDALAQHADGTTTNPSERSRFARRRDT